MHLRGKDSEMLWGLLEKMKKYDPDFPTISPASWVYRQADHAVAEFICPDGERFYLGIVCTPTGSHRSEFDPYNYNSLKFNGDEFPLIEKLFCTFPEPIQASIQTKLKGHKRSNYNLY